MALGLLHTIINDIIGHKAAPVQAPAKSDVPSFAEYNQAMLNTKPEDIPLDNLDGTYENLKPGAAIIHPQAWHAPLRPGVTDGSQVALYTPLAKSAGMYDNSSYYAVPINPNALPKPMPLLKPMLQEVNQ